MTKSRILAFTLVIMLTAASAMLWSCGDEISFKIEITDSSGETKTHTVKTGEETLGDALVKAGYIPAGSKDTGFFDTLNGITADYAVDMSFWAFYVNGEMYMDGGVFDVEIDKDAVYSFKYETFDFDTDWGDWDEDGDEEAVE